MARRKIRTRPAPQVMAAVFVLLFAVSGVLTLHFSHAGRLAIYAPNVTGNSIDGESIASLRAEREAMYADRPALTAYDQSDARDPAPPASETYEPFKNFSLTSDDLALLETMDADPDSRSYQGMRHEAQSSSSPSQKEAAHEYQLSKFRLDNYQTMTYCQVQTFMHKHAKDKLRGTGAHIYNLSQYYKVNPAFMIGIAKAETSLGKKKHIRYNNPANLRWSPLQNGNTDTNGETGGWTGYSVFESYRRGFKGMAYALRHYYVYGHGPRRTVKSVSNKWLDPSADIIEDWRSNVHTGMVAALKQKPQYKPGTTQCVY